MAATTLVIPETDSEEGYERPIDIQTEGLGAAGFYPQHPQAGEADLAAGIERDAQDNLILKDPVAGAKKLSDLVSTSTADELLVDDPKNSHSFAYVPLDSDTPTTLEWRGAGNILLKSQHVTYDTNDLPTQVVTKVYASDGVTVTAQTTMTITHDGDDVSTSTTRDI